MKKKIITLLLLTTLTLAGCGENASSSQTNTTTTTDQATPEQTTESPSTTESSISDDQQSVDDASTAIHALNEECAIGNWAVIATNAEIVDTVEENDYYGFTADDGNKYLMIDLTVTNNGTSADTFLPSVGLSSAISAKVVYQGSYEYSSTNLLGYSQEMHDTSVNPLSSKSGRIAFEIPDSVADSADELILTIQAGKDSLEIKIR